MLPRTDVVCFFREADDGTGRRPTSSTSDQLPALSVPYSGTLYLSVQIYNAHTYKYLNTFHLFQVVLVRLMKCIQVPRLSHIQTPYTRLVFAQIHAVGSCCD